MDTPKYINTNDAAKLYKGSGFGEVDYQTIRNWCLKYDIGIKIGGQWKIDEAKFKLFLEGQSDEKN